MADLSHAVSAFLACRELRSVGRLRLSTRVAETWRGRSCCRSGEVSYPRQIESRGGEGEYPVHAIARAMQNGSVESFNGRFRDELLNEHAFPTLFHARSEIEAWRIDYNLCRPHTALARFTPVEFIQHYQKTSNSGLLVA